MQKVTSQKRLNIDRKMISILSLVAVLGVCLVIIIVIATNSLSALRAYSTLQVNWAESRKEAAHQLGEYFESGIEEYRIGFKNSMKLIRSSTAAREELLSQDTNSSLVHEHLLNAGMMSREISGMITTFERFKT